MKRQISTITQQHTGSSKSLETSEDLHAHTYAKPLPLLEDVFMAFIVALRVRSGSTGTAFDPRVQLTIKDKNDANRLYISLWKRPGDWNQLTAEVSGDVIFAALYLFVSVEWNDQKGALIEEKAWENLRAAFTSGLSNFTIAFTEFLMDITFQNSRCLAALIGLLRELKKDSRNKYKPDDLDHCFADLLLPTGQTVNNNPSRLDVVSILQRLVDDYESLFEIKEPFSAFSDLSDRSISSSPKHSKRREKRSEPPKRQAPKGLHQTQLPAYQSPASSAKELTLAENPKNAKSSSSRPDLAVAVKRPTTYSMSRTRLSKALVSFTGPKKRLLAAASDANGASSIALILAEHQFDKDVLGYALIRASKANRVDNMKLLVEDGAYITCLGEESNQTPLSAAVEYEHESAVDYLLARGVDVNYTNQHIKPALHIAADRRSIYLMKELYLAGALWDPPGIYDNDNDARTAFFNAVRSSNPEIVHIAIQAGALADGFVPYWKTPLTYALHERKEHMVRVLVENGAETCRTGRKTPMGLVMAAGAPMELAIDANEPSQVQLLLDHEAIPSLGEARRLLDYCQERKRKYEAGLMRFPDGPAKVFENLRTILCLIQDVFNDLQHQYVNGQPQENHSFHYA